jgi:hypothetical protein
MLMRLWWALAGGWLLLGSAAAHAQPAEEDIARAHFQAGSGYFDTGDYEAAVREFERAYALSPHPQLLYNLYMANERLGDWAEAARYLQEYLRSAEDVTNREALEARLAHLKRRSEPKPVASAEPVPAASAQPVPAATPEQPPASAAAAEPASDAEPGHSERFVAALASFGVAAAGAITFGVAGGLALKEDRALAGRCGRDAGQHCSDADLNPLETRSTVADAGLGVLVVGSVVGVALLWLDRRAEKARAARAVQPMAALDAHGGALLVGGRF